MDGHSVAVSALLALSGLLATAPTGSTRPNDDRRLLHGLTVLWPSYVTYALTFLFIGQVWVNHHVMFDHIRAASKIRRSFSACSMAPPGHARPRRVPRARERSPSSPD